MSVLWMSMGGADFHRRVSSCGEYDDPSFQSPQTVSRTKPDEEPVQFVLTVGLEGTGHHLMGGLADRSPSLQALLNVDSQGSQMQALSTAFFNSRRNNGLWNGHCGKRQSAHDMVRAENVVVEKMKYLRTSLLDARSKGEIKDSTVRIPVNTLNLTKQAYGMLSFPNTKGDCRSLNYPSLDLFYHTCRKADVDCRHVYIYRDPAHVLVSTTVKREFNRNLLAAMQLYKSMLHIIAAEMTKYSEHTLGCVGFYQGIHTWQDTIRELWGWKNQTVFQELISTIYTPPLNHSKDRDLIPAELAPYWDVFQEAHDFAIEACRLAPYQLENSQPTTLLG